MPHSSVLEKVEVVAVRDHHRPLTAHFQHGESVLCPGRQIAVPPCVLQPLVTLLRGESPPADPGLGDPQPRTPLPPHSEEGVEGSRLLLQPPEAPSDRVSVPDQPPLLSEGVEAVESHLSALPHGQHLLGGVKPHKHKPGGKILNYLLTDDVHHAEECGDLGVSPSPASSVSQLGEIPDSHSPVLTGGDEDVPGRVDSQGGHPVLVAAHGGQLGPTEPVPDPDGAVVTGAEQPGVERVPAYRPHVVGVASQSEPPPVSLGVPEENLGVGAPTGQQAVLVVTGESEDWAVVGRELPGLTRAGVLLVVETSDLTTGEATVN